MINRIRGFSVVLCFAIFGLGAVLLRYLVMIFPEIFIKDKEKKLKICSKILHKSWIIFVGLLEFWRIIKIKREEAERIKNIKNSIIVSTHPCFLDVVVLMSIIPNTTCFVAEKLGKNPFLNGMVDLLFILESQDIEKWSKSAKYFFDKGYNIVIFPMGGRHKKDEQPKIRKGASLLAQISKKNIVILKLETSYDFLQRNQHIYEIQKEPAIYSISQIKDINTEEMLLKYPDEVTFRGEITKMISRNLYFSSK